MRVLFCSSKLKFFTSVQPKLVFCHLETTLTLADEEQLTHEVFSKCCVQYIQPNLKISVNTGVWRVLNSSWGAQHILHLRYVLEVILNWLFGQYNKWQWSSGEQASVCRFKASQVAIHQPQIVDLGGKSEPKT